MDLLLGLALGPVIAGLLFLLVQLPSGPRYEISQFPSLPWIVFQLICASLQRTRAVKGAQEIPPIEVLLSKPTRFDAKRLARFRSLIGHKSLPQQEVPLMYPIAESFRLCIQAMLLPQFPLHILGSVLARNRTEVFHALRPEDELVYRCCVGTQLRVTAKGDAEADLISSATRKSDGQAVWRSTLTVIVLGKNRNKSAAPPAAPAASTSAEERKEIEAWRLDGGVGRRFGLINGDLNPIHLHPLTSFLFGFKRPIAHALFLVAKAEASLRNAGLCQSAYPMVLETEFKRPTLLPAKLSMTVRGGDASTSKEVSFAVVTSDSPPKDVIVGKLTQGA